jgi:two-component system response regulator RegX3
MTRVLVVEDEASLRETLVYLLQKEGYDVIEAEDGNKAVEAFNEFGANIICST